MREEGYVYVDVRSVPEFEAGHPAGAINVPILHQDPVRGMVPNPDFLAVMQANFPRDARIVLGCQVGGRSYRACEILERVGYPHVVDQRAGFGGARDPAGRVVEPGWLDAGLPVEQGPGGEGQSYASLVKKAG
jgi:rhodanese-related sulfurtransferase